MKKLIGTVFFIQLIVIGVWGIFIQPGIAMGDAIWVDEKSGIIVDQADPVNTTIAYYSLINENSFKATHRLLTAAGKKVMTPEVIEKLNNKVILENTDIVKYYPVRQLGNNYALVGHIRVIGKKGAALVGVTILKSSDSGWEITSSADFKGLNDDTLIALFDNAITISEEILADEDLELSEQQQQQVTSQASSMRNSLTGAKKKI